MSIVKGNTINANDIISLSDQVDENTTNISDGYVDIYNIIRSLGISGIWMTDVKQIHSGNVTINNNNSIKHRMEVYIKDGGINVPDSSKGLQNFCKNANIPKSGIVTFDSMDSFINSGLAYIRSGVSIAIMKSAETFKGSWYGQAIDLYVSNNNQVTFTATLKNSVVDITNKVNNLAFDNSVTYVNSCVLVNAAAVAFLNKLTLYNSSIYFTSNINSLQFTSSGLITLYGNSSLIFSGVSSVSAPSSNLIKLYRGSSVYAPANMSNLIYNAAYGNVVIG